MRLPSLFFLLVFRKTRQRGAAAPCAVACRASPPKRRLWRMQRGGDGAAVSDWQGGPAAADRAGQPQEGLRSKFKSVPSFSPCHGGDCLPLPTLFLFFSPRLHPSPNRCHPPPAPRNAPGFALFGRFRVRFSLFPCFSGAKFSALFLCILLHSVYKLKPSVIPCKREVSFLT